MTVEKEQENYWIVRFFLPIIQSDRTCLVGQWFPREVGYFIPKIGRYIFTKSAKDMRISNHK